MRVVWLFAVAASLLLAAPAAGKTRPVKVTEPKIQEPVGKAPTMQPALVREAKGKVCPHKFSKTMHRGKISCVACPRGFSYVTYQGKETCVRCERGASYSKLNGAEVCLRCAWGFYHVTYKGKDVCARCPRGARYDTHQGQQGCLQ